MIHSEWALRHEIKQVLLDEEIYDRITDDNSPLREDYELPKEYINYIGGYVHGEIASLFIVHEKRMHFMVLKKYRKHARELLKESFKLWPRSVYVVIPTLHKSVINFAKKFGFKHMGIEKDSHIKNGKLYDCHKLHYEVNNVIYR